MCLNGWFYVDAGGTAHQMVLCALVVDLTHSMPMNSMIFRCGHFPKGGKSTYVLSRINVSRDKVSKALSDGHVLLKRWEAEGVAKKTETVTFVPFRALRLIFHRQAGQRLSAPVTVETTRYTGSKPAATERFTLRTVAEYDDFRAKYDKMVRWLDKQ